MHVVYLLPCIFLQIVAYRTGSLKKKIRKTGPSCVNLASLVYFRETDPSCIDLAQI